MHQWHLPVQSKYKNIKHHEIKTMFRNPRSMPLSPGLEAPFLSPRTGCWHPERCCRPGDPARQSLPPGTGSAGVKRAASALCDWMLFQPAACARKQNRAPLWCSSPQTWEPLSWCHGISISCREQLLARTDSPSLSLAPGRSELIIRHGWESFLSFFTGSYNNNNSPVRHRLFHLQSTGET